MILCPACRSTTRVMESRKSNGNARRRRICDSTVCQKRITTLEVIVSSEPGRQASLMANPVMLPKRELKKILRVVQRAMLLPVEPYSEDEKAYEIAELSNASDVNDEDELCPA